jgi:hypothetical protein
VPVVRLGTGENSWVGWFHGHKCSRGLVMATLPVWTNTR